MLVLQLAIQSPAQRPHIIEIIGDITAPRDTLQGPVDLPTHDVVDAGVLNSNDGEGRERRAGKRASPRGEEPHGIVADGVAGLRRSVRVDHDHAGMHDDGRGL
jgi:hypothetical protein